MILLSNNKKHKEIHNVKQNTKNKKK